MDSYLHLSKSILSFIVKTTLQLNQNPQLQKQSQVSSRTLQTLQEAVINTDLRQNDTKVYDTTGPEVIDYIKPNLILDDVIKENENMCNKDMCTKDFIFDTEGYGIYEIPFLKDHTPFKTSNLIEKNINSFDIDPFTGFDPLFQENSIKESDKTVEFFESLGQRLDLALKTEQATIKNFEEKQFSSDSVSPVKKECSVSEDILFEKVLKEEIFKAENLILEINNMTHIEKTDVTADTFLTSETKYLIKRNGVEYAFADEEKVAISIVNSLATDEVKKLTNDRTHVFLRADREDRRVQIYTQAIGIIMNSGITKNTIFEILPVRKIFFVHSDPVGFSKEEVKRFEVSK